MFAVHTDYIVLDIFSQWWVNPHVWDGTIHGTVLFLGQELSPSHIFAVAWLRRQLGGLGLLASCSRASPPRGRRPELWHLRQGSGVGPCVPEVRAHTVCSLAVAVLCAGLSSVWHLWTVATPARLPVSPSLLCRSVDIQPKMPFTGHLHCSARCCSPGRRPGPQLAWAVGLSQLCVCGGSSQLKL